MNPKYHLLAAVAALSLGACSTDDTCTEPVPENGGYKLTFTVADDPETRTTLDAGDVLRWVPTDKVGIYTVGKNTNPNTLTVADVNQSPVEFIGVLKKLVSPGDQFYAYYPYDAAQSTNPSAVKLSIPAEQKQTKAGVYNGESHPLVALPMEFPWERDSYACRMSSVRFRQLGAIVELQLYSSNEALGKESIRSVTFESENTPLAGDFRFNLTTVTDTEELRISGYESKKATTVLEEPATIPAASNEAARVYLTIAPGQYTGSIVVKTDITQYTFRLAEAMTFERAVIKGLPADLAKAEREAPVTENDLIHFEDPIVEEICLEHWDTDGDYQLSYKEAAAVTSINSQFKGKLIRSFNELRYFTGLQSIGAYAFSSCSNLTSIHIPNGVTAIESDTFKICSSLTSIHLPDGLTAIASAAFRGCSSLTSINIPNGVTEIGSFAFEGCSSLTSIHIPDGVTAIERYAFSGCSSLTSITIPNGVTRIDERTFRGCSSLTNINIPDGVTWILDSAFEGCSSLTSIHIPDGVTAIERYAFSGCSSLTSINIPEGVTEIRNGAFSGCSSLTSINIPEGVTAIGSGAFSDCSNLTSIKLPDGMTEIGEGAFQGCSSLTSINIPKKVSSIGTKAFLGCSSLFAFYGRYASADHRCLTKYGELLAFAPADLTEYTIPNGVVGIRSHAFGSCSSLTSITIPAEVTAIGDYAFSGCSSLTSIYCKPTTPPTLGISPFWNTTQLSKIYVPAASVEAYKTVWGRSKIFAFPE